LNRPIWASNVHNCQRRYILAGGTDTGRCIDAAVNMITAAHLFQPVDHRKWLLQRNEYDTPSHLSKLTCATKRNQYERWKILPASCQSRNFDLNIGSINAWVVVVLSWTLQLHCKFPYCHKMSSVCGMSLSVTQMYCDKTAKSRSCNFNHDVAQCLITWHAKFDDEIRRGSPRLGTQTRVGWFLTLRCYISETVRDRA